MLPNASACLLCSKQCQHIVAEPTYSKEPIAVVGSTEVQVAYEGQIAKLPLVVVKGEGPTLLGTNWLDKIRLNWSKTHYASGPGLHDLLSKYGVIFHKFSRRPRGLPRLRGEYRSQS